MLYNLLRICCTTTTTTSVKQPFFLDKLGKPAPERQNHLDFNEERDNGVAVASAGPYANHLHLVPDRYHASTSPLTNP